MMIPRDLNQLTFKEAGSVCQNLAASVFESINANNSESKIQRTRRVDELSTSSVKNSVFFSDLLVSFSITNGYLRKVPRNALRIPRFTNRVPSFSPCHDSFNEYAGLALSIFVSGW